MSPAALSITKAPRLRGSLCGAFETRGSQHLCG